MNKIYQGPKSKNQYVKDVSNMNKIYQGPKSKDQYLKDV